MERTKKRPLVSGEISAKTALIFSIVIGVLGFSLLLITTHPLVTLIGLVGFIDYVWLYGAWSKRKSIHGTLVGSISGATPILAGYIAVSQQIDLGAVLVFLILFLWQMPEFYSIAIFRQKEYQAANVPIISVVKGVEETKRQIVGYTLIFVTCTLLLSALKYAGVTYLMIMSLAGGYWLWLGIIGQKTDRNDAWARKMFRFSLIILLLFCLLISIDHYLP